MSGRGSVEFEECEIAGDAKARIAVWAESDPVFRRYQIHGNRTGVTVFENGRPTFEDCEFQENGKNLKTTAGCEVMQSGTIER